MISYQGEDYRFPIGRDTVKSKGFNVTEQVEGLVNKADHRLDQEGMYKLCFAILEVSLGAT